MTLQQMEDIYVWAESHQEAEYFNWASRQPNNENDQNCVWKAVTKQSYRGWHDAPCTDSLWHGEVHALCEYDL